MILNSSPNMLKTYQTCPRKYYYKYIIGLSVPVSSLPFEKGKKIHALADYFLRGVNISRIETALSDEEKSIWKLLLENPFFQKDYFNSEYNLSCKVGDYWVGGRLDAVVYSGKDCYILDYKTGSTPKNPEFDYQTMIYLLCLSKFLKEYDSLSFVYINLRTKNNYVIKFNEQLKEKYEARITSICDEISNDNIFKCNLSNCEHCEYSKICSKEDRL